MNPELCSACILVGRTGCWFVEQVNQIISQADKQAAKLSEGADLTPLACTIFQAIANNRKLADRESCPNLSYDPPYAGKSYI